MRRLAAAAAALMLPALLPAQQPGGNQPIASSIASRTEGFERRDGFIPVYLDARQGRLLLELPGDSTRMLFWVSQATGLGSNPIGIDRGAAERDHVARFDRAGDRVVVTFENLGYRSSDTANTDHQRSIAEAFPSSPVAALPLLAVEGGRLLVDATELAYRDWNDVVGTLARAEQGSYSIARDRSRIVRELTSAFPDNTEISVSLAFANNGGREGGIVRQLLPDARALALRQHISLLRLPEPGYRPRVRDRASATSASAFATTRSPSSGRS